MFTLAGKELRSLFYSPLAWVVLAVVQLLLGYFFLLRLDSYLLMQPRLAMLASPPGVTDMVVAPLFGNAAIVLLLVAPLITMGTVAGERQRGTLNLLRSAPVSPLEIVLGKYLGLIVFFAVMLGITCLMPLSLLLGGTLDFGKFASGILGIGLLICAFAAAGLFLSTLTEQPMIAAVSTFGLLLLLWIIDWAARSSGNPDGVLSYLSLMGHYQAFLKGLFTSRDFFYYLIFIALMLALSVRKLEAERYQG